ncbi:MAG: GH3 auxin-responsive promoter family protein [Zoogloeaceae bacterium]|jgi:hypothetical protein|nr:GH3 auxin-responsive promoter family protein [Zoogloeaceae bacterium]
MSTDKTFGVPWLEEMLARNANTAYLRHYGSPRSLGEFCERVPLAGYEQLMPWLARITDGEKDVLFAGAPVAYERTGGSSAGARLIPYSHEGLLDFQRNLCPWIAHLLKKYAIRGKVYFAISPAMRAPELINGLPVGMPDAAYLGNEMGNWLARHSAISPDIAQERNLERWREKTIQALCKADDLEFISVWSPTFLLRLLEEIPNPPKCWPRLKLLSCWHDAASRPHAQRLARLLPHAHLQPKGLLSTEAVISVPDIDDRTIPAQYGFIEFLSEQQTLELAENVSVGASYEVVTTTASGLYRYRTGDIVRIDDRRSDGLPVLSFLGRGSLCCDLVGEKLDEVFVARCLALLATDTLLVPDVQHPGYVLLCERTLTSRDVNAVEARLCANPQYAYARAIGQLAPLRTLWHPRPQALVERILLEHGKRPGALKATALRTEEFWLPSFEAQSPPIFLRKSDV